MKLIRFGAPGREKPGVLARGRSAARRLRLRRGLRRGLLRARRAGPPRGLGGTERDGHPPRGRGRAPGSAHPPPEQDRLHRPELPRPRRGDGGGDPEGARHLLQVHDRARGPERRARHAPRRDQGGLGGRARGRDRPRGPLRERGRCPRARGRLRAAQRLLRAHLPARARRPVGQGQERGHVRAARPLPRHPRRDPRSPGPGHVAQGQRRAPPALAAPRTWSSACPPS